MDEAAAVARAKAGDSEAFRLLVERHGRALLRLAYRMTGNAHDAEDVVQEAFLKAYRGLDRFDERSQVGSWLYRIAANCAFDVLRARQRHEGRLESMDEDDSQAVFALSQLRRDEGVPLLIGLARAHKSHEVREQAMFWLGQSGDSRALAFFEEVL